MNTEPKIVFIDDDANFLQGLRRNLRQISPEWDMEFISSAKEALEKVKEQQNVVLVTDWMMPGMDGLRLCQHIREHQNVEEPGYTYIILLTGKQGTEDLVSALEAGADDYLPKPFDTRELVARIQVGLRILGLEKELRKLNSELAVLATTDPLTQLFNRRHGTKVIEGDLERVLRAKQDLSVILIDLDYFKEVNDTHGHAAGDAVLCEVTRRIQSACRKYDSAVRWGGDEILVICPHSSTEEVASVAERMRRLVNEKPVQVSEEVAVPMTASLGTATVKSGTSLSANDLIDLADRALYEVKEAGRNCVRSVTQ